MYYAFGFVEFSLGVPPGMEECTMGRSRRYRRRPESDGLFELAATSNWKVGACLSVVSAVLGLTFSGWMKGNMYLAGVAPVFFWLGVLAAAAFAVIALVRFFRQRPAGQPSGQREPSAVSAPAYRTHPAPEEKPTKWSLDVIDRVEWKRFEDLCCACFREKGIRADTTRLGADGGIDIHLYQDAADPQRATSIVQCKAWGSPVGVKPVRELRGVMAHEGVEKAFFIAQNGFTDDARTFARDNRISPLDGPALLMMIQRMPDEVQQRLLLLTTEGNWTTPTCPSCGGALVERNGGTKPFWGCQSYPRCRGRLQMRASGWRRAA